VNTTLHNVTGDKNKYFAIKGGSDYQHIHKISLKTGRLYGLSEAKLAVRSTRSD